MTQVTANDAAVVATAQPITKDLADSVAHTAAIHSKNFARRRYAEAAHHNTAMASLPFVKSQLPGVLTCQSLGCLPCLHRNCLWRDRPWDAVMFSFGSGLMHAAHMHIFVNNCESVNMQHAYMSTCRCSGIPVLEGSFPQNPLFIND